MSKSLIVQGLIIFMLSSYAFSSSKADDAAAYKSFLDILTPEDVGNQYCAETFSKADWEYLENRWAQEGKDDAKMPIPSLSTKVESNEEEDKIKRP